MYGPTSAGKSSWVREHFPDVYDVPLPTTTNGQAWFDGYNGERAIVLDDFYSQVISSLSPPRIHSGHFVRYQSPLSSSSPTGSQCRTLSKAGSCLTPATSSSSAAIITRSTGGQELAQTNSSQHSSLAVLSDIARSGPTPSKNVVPRSVLLSPKPVSSSQAKKKGKTTAPPTPLVQVLPSATISTPHETDADRIMWDKYGRKCYHPSLHSDACRCRWRDLSNNVIMA